MKIAFGLLSFFAATAASAHVPVEQMACAQAQAYASHYGMYWKDAGPDGQIPIAPVFQLNTIHCVGRYIVTAQVERTADNRQCVVGYYCNGY